MPNANESEDVHITQNLREALHDYADVTFSIATDAPDDLLTPALRDSWRALWDVGSTTVSPMGDTETPSYVSDLVSVTPGAWKITVDFAHVERAERARVPDLLAAVLRRHAAVPAVVDVTHLTETEYDLQKEASELPSEGPEATGEQPKLFRL